MKRKLLILWLALLSVALLGLTSIPARAGP